MYGSVLKILHEAVDSVSLSVHPLKIVSLFVTVECTFIVLCRKLYEESQHDEVGKLLCLPSQHYISKYLT